MDEVANAIKDEAGERESSMWVKAVTFYEDSTTTCKKPFQSIGELENNHKSLRRRFGQWEKTVSKIGA